MCGIFGVIVRSDSNYSSDFLSKTLKRLAILSESRGKESSGLCFRVNSNNEIRILRAPGAISKLVKTNEFSNYSSLVFSRTNNQVNSTILDESFFVMGHARLVTNGTQLEDHNNQPVIKDDIVAVHNGIIVNVDDLWKKHSDLKKEYDIDTEIMLSIFRQYLADTKSIKAAISKTFQELRGTVAAVMLINDLEKVLLATNNGSLYILSNDNDIFIFASEKYILTRLADNENIQNKIGSFTIRQVHSNTGYIIDLKTFDIENFDISLNGVLFNGLETPNDESFNIKLSSLLEESKKTQRNSLVDLTEISVNPKAASERKLLEYNWEAISKLQRCTKCLLPSTFPHIEYDEKGKCNYCNNYVQKNQPKPLKQLMELVEPFRTKNGEPDCIAPYSGGRDSTFVLHYLKKELGLNPVAFTYDWGMVTDLARRNIARVCGKLGVENIIVSADIRWKRENIRKNISVWLKKPALGMIPLFMAGDKYFFYYTNQIKKQTGLRLNIWGINTLENTDFKTGFAGLAPKFNKKRIYSLDFLSQMKLFAFVGKNLLQSPGYLNQSILDTLGSFGVRYLYPKKDFYSFFDYFQWNEKVIEDTIITEYDWEKAVDTNSTWRIGDGTASFYNYIYCTVAGFSENDTFRSNQIREGLISREEALKKIEKENRPRYETLKWYLEIIGLDFEAVIKQINKIPRLY